MSRIGRCIETVPDMSKLLASLGHTGRRRVVLGHTLNTLQHIIIKISHNVLSKFMILCWAALIAILSCMRPLSHSRRRRVVLGHTLNRLRHIITKKSHNVLSKFMILCWATFTVILGCMWPAGCRLDTPKRVQMS